MKINEVAIYESNSVEMKRLKKELKAAKTEDAKSRLRLEIRKLKGEIELRAERKKVSEGSEDDAFEKANQAMHPVEDQWHYPIMKKHGYEPDTPTAQGFVRAYKYTHPKTGHSITANTGASADYWNDNSSGAGGYYSTLAPHMQSIASSNVGESTVNEATPVNSDTAMTGVQLLAAIKNCMHNLVDAYESEAKPTSPTPTGPGLHHIRYGMVEFAENLDVSGGYYGYPKTFRAFIKVGSNVNNQVLPEMLESMIDYLHEQSDGEINVDAHNTTIKTSDGYTFMLGQVDGTAWSGFGFTISKPAG